MHGQMRNEPFFDCLYRFSLVKAARNARRKKSVIQVRNEYSPQLSKVLYNWQLKNKEAL
jgi:hypothetical protein